MRRTGTPLVAAVLVLVLVVPAAAIGGTGIPPMSVSDGADGPDAAGNPTDGGAPSTGTATPADTGTVEPGAQFAGVIGAHGAHHAGAIDRESVDARLAAADSPGARAAVVADVLVESEARVESLADRQGELATARRNDTMGDSEYRARMAVIDAELRAIERVAIRLEDVAAGLPTAILIEVNVDLGAIRDLEARASALQSSEIERIAPSFARDAGNGTAGSAANVTETPGT